MAEGSILPNSRSGVVSIEVEVPVNLVFAFGSLQAGLAWPKAILILNAVAVVFLCVRT